MVKLTYYRLGDVMIAEMCSAYQKKISDQNPTYRICWKLYEELIDIFSKEVPISEDFGKYLALLEQRRRKQYRRHYEWGRAMAQGTILDSKSDHEPTEEKQDLGQIMEAYSEEIYRLWKLFCCVETYCRTHEAAYMCVLGIAEGEKNGIHPL